MHENKHDGWIMHIYTLMKFEEMKMKHTNVYLKRTVFFDNVMIEMVISSFQCCQILSKMSNRNEFPELNVEGAAWQEVCCRTALCMEVHAKHMHMDCLGIVYSLCCPCCSQKQKLSWCLSVLEPSFSLVVKCHRLSSQVTLRYTVNLN